MSKHIHRTANILIALAGTHLVQCAAAASPQLPQALAAGSPSLVVAQPVPLGLLGGPSDASPPAAYAGFAPGALSGRVRFGEKADDERSEASAATTIPDADFVNLSSCRLTSIQAYLANPDGTDGNKCHLTGVNLPLVREVDGGYPSVSHILLDPNLRSMNRDDRRYVSYVQALRGSVTCMNGFYWDQDSELYRSTSRSDNKEKIALVYSSFQSSSPGYANPIFVHKPDGSLSVVPKIVGLNDRSSLSRADVIPTGIVEAVSNAVLLLTMLKVDSPKLITTLDCGASGQVVVWDETDPAKLLAALEAISFSSPAQLMDAVRNGHADLPTFSLFSKSVSKGAKDVKQTSFNKVGEATYYRQGSIDPKRPTAKAPDVTTIQNAQSGDSGAITAVRAYEKTLEQALKCVSSAYGGIFRLDPSVPNSPTLSRILPDGSSELCCPNLTPAESAFIPSFLVGARWLQQAVAGSISGSALPIAVEAITPGYAQVKVYRITDANQPWGGTTIIDRQGYDLPDLPLFAEGARDAAKERFGNNI